MQFYKLPKFDGVNARAVRAWREYYIDYRALKRLLDMYDNLQQKIMRNLPIAGVTKRQPTDELPTSIAIPELQSNNTYIDMRLAYIGKQLSTYPIEEQEQVCSEAFAQLFTQDIDKCNAFYIHETRRLANEYDELYMDICRVQRALKKMQRHKDCPLEISRIWSHIRALCKSIHAEMRDMRSFTRVNFMLALRLIKLYRQSSGKESRAALLFRHLKDLEFTHDSAIAELSTKAEKEYADCFTFGHLGLAQKELYAPRSTSWQVFRVGIRLGGVVMLFLWVLWETTTSQSNGVDLFGSYVINIYAATGGLILFGWLWGLNLIVWQSAALDYASILGYTTPLMNIQEVYLDVSFATMVYLGNIILFYKCVREHGLLDGAPVWLLPMLMIAFCAYKMVFPWAQRKEVWLTIFQVVFSPFCEVAFRQTYMGDYMTSFNMILVEMVLTGCYVNHDTFMENENETMATQLEAPEGCGPHSVARKYIAPAVLAAPLCFRLMQCLKVYYLTGKRFPNLANATKYGLALSVVLFSIFNSEHITADSRSIFHIFWVIATVVTTLYSWTWDIIMDWSLLQAPNGLRPNLYYYDTVWLYYVAIVANLGLRFLWTITLISNGSVFAKIIERLRYFLPAAELFRRSMWSWLRIENAVLAHEAKDGLLDMSESKKRELKGESKRSHLLCLIHLQMDEVIKKFPQDASYISMGSFRFSPTRLSAGLSRDAACTTINEEPAPGQGEGVSAKTAGEKEGEDDEEEDNDDTITIAETVDDDKDEDEERAKRNESRNLEQKHIILEIILFLLIFSGIGLLAGLVKRI